MKLLILLLLSINVCQANSRQVTDEVAKSLRLPTKAAGSMVTSTHSLQCQIDFEDELIHHQQDLGYKYEILDTGDLVLERRRLQYAIVKLDDSTTDPKKVFDDRLKCVRFLKEKPPS